MSSYSLPSIDSFKWDEILRESTKVTCICPICLKKHYKYYPLNSNPTCSLACFAKIEKEDRREIEAEITFQFRGGKA